MTNLITYAYFRELTDVSENIDDKTIKPKLKMAHDQLKFIIGRNFYDQLTSQYPNYSGDNLAFYDPYVKEYLAWQAYAYYVPRSNSYETRTGIRVFKEENSDAVSDKVLGELISLGKQNAEFYKGAMINFLTEAQKNNSASYPLYTDKWPASKMGAQFSITAVKGRDHRFSRINTKTTINSDAPDSPVTTNFPQQSNTWP